MLMLKASASNGGGSTASAIRELSAVPDDIALLQRFYRDVYLPEFPDPDERESLANMIHYLELKGQGWYGANNYHIVLMLECDRPVAGTVCDYLASADSGVIEFLAVAPDRRRHGLGKRLLHWIESTLLADAGSRTTRALSCIVAEMHDPRLPDAHHASLDPLARARIWSKWGYRKLDFDYVQPPLSATQQAARHLMLLAKIPNGVDQHDAVSAQQLCAVLREYLIWAMRIEDPEQTIEYQEMEAQLEGRSSVDLIPLVASP